jgi:hypothetical protein
MRKISVSRKELEDFAINVLGIAKMELRRMSTQILAQLLQLKIKGDARVFFMADEIKQLEKIRPGAVHLKRDDIREIAEDQIVFKQYNGSNYYLTLAKPGEGDQNINRRVRQAYEFDFPFLQETRRAK